MTLIELVVATALLSLIVLAVFQFMRQFLSLWSKSEARREIVEEASGILELFAEDLGAVQNGPRGDLVAEWVTFDTDGDGSQERVLPRLRLVRPASPAEMQRLEAGEAEPENRLEGERLLEICWVALPAAADRKSPERRAEAILMRGERVEGPDGSGGLSYFDAAFFGADGKPRSALSEVSGGVLWLGIELASQTTVLAAGWEVGVELADAASCWDAWNRDRPDPLRHPWNEPSVGMPAALERALLPRRVRLELELEHPAEVKRRPRLAAPLQPNESRIEVDDGSRLPQEPGAHLLIDGEWMQLLSTEDYAASVKRGVRGTSARPHEAGAIVHFGRGTLREIVVRTHQEDWNL